MNSVLTSVLFLLYVIASPRPPQKTTTTNKKRRRRRQQQQNNAPPPPPQKKKKKKKNVYIKNNRYSQLQSTVTVPTYTVVADTFDKRNRQTSNKYWHIDTVQITSTILSKNSFFVCCCFFFCFYVCLFVFCFVCFSLLPSTSVWSVYSETFIHYDISLSLFALI